MRRPNQVKYSLNKEGRFLIENYNQSKPFSNFFPGIAGLLGIPMWVFYVNRGQCITSFGIESKDKAIMEFQPANKAYRATSLQGFRTFVKARSKGKSFYWEPFQENLKGTEFKKKQNMFISAHDLTIEEINEELDLAIKVTYFTLPEEPYAALVRNVVIENRSKKDYEIEIIDGLPIIVPYGLKDWLAKHMSRTVEAWIKVRNIENKAPFYHLKVEVSDTPEVTHIKEGNFFLSFTKDKKGNKLLSPIAESASVFGTSFDFSCPENFLNNGFLLPKTQNTNNKTPCAMGYLKTNLKPKEDKTFVSFFGYAHNISQVNEKVGIIAKGGYVEKKEKKNREIIAGIRSFAFTKSSSSEFDLYAEYTFLDNILRGGLPVSIHTKEGNISFNVFSRKHGDIERDYNFFLVPPTYYSQGNGNYRDVNQNRRNDAWFNKDVKDGHVVTFLNLIQADGYNPLVVKGTSFSVIDMSKIVPVLKKYIDSKNISNVKDHLSKNFMPGALLTFISHNNIKLKGDPKEFLGNILNFCHKHEIADHGEGFWTDHWTYTLDIIESYSSLYPENIKELLLDRSKFTFFHNNHYVMPRHNRYVLVQKGIRQFKSVKDASQEVHTSKTGHLLRTKNGHGEVYRTSLVVKLLCVIANKVATLDPSGIGVEMEAGKPNWYDALNGLPGLLGSSVSETFELKRHALFLMHSFEEIGSVDRDKVYMYKELSGFITGLTRILEQEKDALSYWDKSNSLKESYRQSIIQGIDGSEAGLTIAQIVKFLELVVKKIESAEILAKKDKKGELSTYFYHEVEKHEKINDKSQDGHPYIKPINFKRHALPLFLEGNVHELRCEEDIKERKVIYRKVKESDLYDKKIKMYKVNADLTKETEEIGRTSIFPRGWLENESIWLHMEYKFMLELLRGGLYEEFYENFKNVLVPFLKPETYGRSILENSSFLVSSAHEDKNLHGQGFVARLSGSTAEVIHIWLLMNIGAKPFCLNEKGDLVLKLNPALPGWLFTKERSEIEFLDAKGKVQNIDLPQNIYAFKLLGSTLVIYHNSKRKNTFGKDKAVINTVQLTYPGRKKQIIINSSIIPSGKAEDIRDNKVSRIDVYFD